MKKTVTIPKYEKMQTDEGEIEYAKYEFCGVTYLQKELYVYQAEEIGILFTTLDIDGLISLESLGQINIGKFLVSLIKAKLVVPLLKIVLSRMDGKEITEEELRKSPLRLFHPFIGAVVRDFFTLNGEASKPIIEFAEKFTAFFRVVVEALPVATSYLSALVETWRLRMQSEKQHTEEL